MIRELQSADREKIVEILNATQFFSEEEILIAKEILDVYCDEVGQQDYMVYVSEENNLVNGYVCIGKTPATTGTFDLYWIAVDPESQGRGTGTLLFNYAKEKILAQQGNLIISETSSTPKYIPTQKFYEAKGFVKLAQIKNYYKPHDDLMIYGLYL